MLFINYICDLLFCYQYTLFITFKDEKMNINIIENAI